ncbi:[protein-PII] uridylyltransferase [Brevifollis gellanilyticus]|uniref:Bifunctional uridylyltransferase/uridylyl-removing enzyme n=1 Tax=Brevifollis gellanilyticus TaxID=748831 RepID=A0A512M9L3_9BACT|nr:[protein-PII] uridylyltransferase [Brevifollis gellanilyticus]GEP43426.1 bifunctional uridylyltransferase/uridylyl-removing enzyme [Brevifollis gellanilyticus]
MTEREYQKHLESVRKKIFGDDSDLPRSRSETLKLAKQFLKLKEQRIKQRHRAGMGGVEICRMRSDVMDCLVNQLWKESLATLPAEKQGKMRVSVVAHGGYGRRVMSPHSDLDLTFILPGNSAQVPPEIAKFIADYLLYFYDLKFKVGLGTRSAGGCIELANEDMLTKTALMEARLLCGDPKGFDEFRSRFDKECLVGKEAEFLKQRQNDLTSRHLKHGGTHCVQEPNIKNGCGGLRDYQNLIWMTYVKAGTLNPKDLVQKGHMSPLAWRELAQAYDFILRVRNEMHYSERRASDVLTLRLQGVVATNLSYRHKKILRRIEAFMRDYYTSTRDILQRSSEVMDSLNLAAMADQDTRKGLLSFMVRRKAAQKRPEKFDGFVEKAERLFPEEPGIYKEDPTRLMRTFLHTQQRHLRMSPELFQLMQVSFRLVNVSYRYNKSVRETFLAILGNKGDVARVLRQMHRVGFLGRYMPEFGALTCLVQHEFFHRYTADEHTLRTIDKLDELSDAHVQARPLYQKLFHDLQQPEILYLALLLHDAGRAANAKAHDAESTVMADAVARRLLIKGERRKLLLFLVDNHLLMYRTATTANLDDPQVIGEMAAMVKTKEYLDTLLVMTYADSKGTSEASWSGYKEASILQLYHNTLAYLDAPADFMRRVAVPLDEVRASVVKELEDGYNLEISAHFQHMPRSYFNYRDPAQIAAHIRQFRQFFVQLTKEDPDAGLMPVMTWEDHPEQGYSDLIVTCWDRHLLLARISGALAAQSINILSADLYQRGDNLVLDIFRVCNTNFAAVTNKSAKLRVEQAVRAAFLEQKFDFAPAIAASRKAAPGFDEVMDEIPQRVFINNEVSPSQTVAELQVVDRLGLLYDLFMAIGKLDLSVTHARISTEKGVAIDAIYIQTAGGDKIRDKEELDQLKSALEAAVFQLPGDKKKTLEAAAA